MVAVPFAIVTSVQQLKYESATNVPLATMLANVSFVEELESVMRIIVQIVRDWRRIEMDVPRLSI